MSGPKKRGEERWCSDDHYHIDVDPLRCSVTAMLPSDPWLWRRRMSLSADCPLPSRVSVGCCMSCAFVSRTRRWTSAALDPAPVECSREGSAESKRCVKLPFRTDSRGE